MMFERAEASILRQRLQESPYSLIIIAGPRQVGKTTLVRQVLESGVSGYVAADAPHRGLEADDAFAGNFTSDLSMGSAVTEAWLIQQWEVARLKAQVLPKPHKFVLVIDEIQKIPRWSELVKGLWDQDRANDLNLHVVLLGSAPLMMQQGLTESLAGRYELISLHHWSYSEMEAAFQFSLEEYIYFGGYPGSAKFIRDETRWRTYVKASLIDPNIQKDILQMTRVDKPALLKNLFELGCGYSGQMISYTKLLGQLQGAGNTVTLAHYLTLLGQAGLLKGIDKFAGEKHRQRASSPKLHALNTALISAQGDYSFAEAKADRSHWGHLVESTVGAHLLNTTSENCAVQYWRESALEVDFVLSRGKRLVAIEVKSGQKYEEPKGLATFCAMYTNTKALVVGERGIPLDEFLRHPMTHWFEG